MLFNSKKSGFKLLSLLFVVGLTFAACSQDVDDQIGNLQSQIDKEAAARSEAVSKLEDQLKSLQATHAADIKKLQDAQEELSKAIENAEKAAKEFASAEADAAEAAAKAYADAQDAVVLATAKAAAAEAEANAKAYTEAQIATLKATLEQEITSATAELKAKHEADIAALQAKDAELEQAIAAAETKLNQKIDAEIARIEKAHKADIDRLDAAIDALQGQVNDILAWETTAKTQIAANETAIAALKGDLAAVKGDLATETSNRKKADDALQTALNTLGSKVDANYSELIGKIEELIKADDALYAAIVDNAKKIKDLQDADVELGKRIDGVVADLKKATEDINAEIVKICGKIDDLYDKYDAAAKEIAALKEKDGQQDKDIQAAIAKAEQELAEARTEIATEIANAVKEANQYTDRAVNDLKIALDAVDTKLRDSITVLSGTPTTLIFKPVAFRNGIETVVFEPVFYYSMENDLNDEVGYGSYLNKYEAFDFKTPLADYDPYIQNTDVDKDKKPINKVDWWKSTTHYVNLPAEVHYFVNPSNASIKDLKLNYPDVKFIGNVAETRGYTDENEDIAGLIALNYNSNYTNTIEDQTLKFRVDLVSKAINKDYPNGTTDFANNENGKINFGWPTFADFGGKQNPNYYSGRVDAGYGPNDSWCFYDNSSKEELLEKIRNAKVTFRGNCYWFVNWNENTWNQSYVFATQIPFAGNDETVKGKTVVSDYAQVAVEPGYAEFALVTKGSTDEYLNPNKYDAYALEGNSEGTHKPQHVGTSKGDKTIVYDLYAGEDNGVPFGFDPNKSYKLTDFIDLLECDWKYYNNVALYDVDATRMEDLGFQYRFYVPMAKASDKTKNVDLWGDMVKEFGHENYLGPNFGPWEYYCDFGEKYKIDFQDYLKVDAKTGQIEILNPDVSKGFTPVVLAQVIDTRRPYSPVVTEAYFRLAIKGDEVKGQYEFFDFPACGKKNVEVVVENDWFAQNVYNKLKTNVKRFNYYFTPTIKEATPNTYFEWRKWNDDADHSKGYTVAASFEWDQNDKTAKWIYGSPANLDPKNKYYLVMCTPFKDLVGKMTEKALDNKTQITWTLGGNVVTLDLNAKAALPVIQLAYSDSYWDGAVLPKHGDADFFATIVANPNPASERTESKYCSFDFDLTTGFNHFEQPAGYAQDRATKIYYKATFDGRDVSKQVDGCYTFDIVPALFNNSNSSAPWFNYGSKDEDVDRNLAGDQFRYSFSKDKTFYRTLGNKANSKPYFDYSNALWYRYGSGYGFYNILLKEATNAQHTTAQSNVTIGTEWGFQKGIDLLEGDYDVPCLVFATFTDGDEYAEQLAIEQFKLDYRKPIYVKNKQNKPFEFKDILGTDQIIKTTDVVALTDWCDSLVTAKKVNLTHTPGVCTPDDLSAYYNVQNPVFVSDSDGQPIFKTDLKVNADGTYTHQCIGDFTDFSKINALKGQLPDKTVLKFDADGNIYYQNAGASLDQAYHIFVQVNVTHKWGVAHGWVVIQVNPNKK